MARYESIRIVGDALSAVVHITHGHILHGTCPSAARAIGSLYRTIQAAGLEEGDVDPDEVEEVLRVAAQRCGRAVHAFEERENGDSDTRRRLRILSNRIHGICAHE